MRLGRLSVASLLLLLPTAAWAGPLDVTANNNAAQLVTALLGTTTGLSGFSQSLVGDPTASGTFVDGPFGLGSGVVLSTGRVTTLEGSDTVENAGTDLGAGGPSGDTTSLTINFTSDATVSSLFFQYVFGSEEFYEYIGSNYNDSFTLTLDGVNYAKLVCGQEVRINNFTGACASELIDNSGGTETQLDAFTKALLFSAPLTAGAHQLVLTVADVQDGVWDSAVFIKGGTVGTVNPVPDGGATLGLLGLALVGLGSLRRKFRG